MLKKGYLYLKNDIENEKMYFKLLILLLFYFGASFVFYILRSHWMRFIHIW